MNMRNVFFLPYKADMWDSMQSIYEAALKENNMNIYVMPIPYYERNSDSSLGRLIYEGERFSTEMDIVDYQRVNLLDVHPEIIFIHNPYDEYNTITWIDDLYSTRSLFECTDNLLYVPYFIDTRGIEQASYCMPGLMRCRRIYVQSEMVKKAYLNANKYLKEEQIVALGSPKIDVLINASEKSDNLTETWKLKINKRKTFFINIHIEEILNDIEHFFERLNSIYEIILKRIDCFFIWRPHPLTIATIRNIGKDHLSRYRIFCNKLQSLENCLVDYTSDMYRGILLSDAYIGDESSLVLLYALTQKPLLLYQSITEKHIPAKSVCGISVQQKIYCVLEKYNLFVCKDKSGEMKILDLIDEEEKYNLYSYSCIFDNCIWFIPRFARKILKYYIDQDRTEYIDLPFKVVLKYGIKGIFSGGILQEEFLWCIPIGISQLVRINLKESIIEVICDKLTDNYGFRDGVLINGCLYLCPYLTKKLSVVNIVTLQNKTFEIADEIKQYTGITYDGNNLWFSPGRTNILMKTDLNFQDMEYYEIYPKEFEGVNQGYFNGILFRNGVIWIYPDKAQAILLIDINTMDIKYLVENSLNGISYYSFSERSAVTSQINYFFDDKKEILLFTCAGNAIISLNPETLELKGYPLERGNDFTKFKDMLMDYRRDNLIEKEFPYIYYENKLSVETFIDLVLQDKDPWKDRRISYFSGLAMNIDGTCGEKIWQDAKRLIL